MRRSRLIVLITAGVLVTLGGLVVVVAVVVTVQAHLFPPDRCRQPVGTCSASLTVEQIEELSSVDLPAGTEVLESEYRSALDSYMTATVRLPEGSPPPALDPELVWDGSTLGPDGVAREATTEVGDDGRIRMEIRAFDV